MAVSAREELDRTKSMINEELEMIESLKRTPRKMGLFEKIVNFFKEKVFHRVQYVQEEQLGAKFVDDAGTHMVSDENAKQAMVSEADAKDQIINEAPEKEKPELVPGHKTSFIHKSRDKKAYDMALNEITDKDKSYIAFRDTGYLARIEKTDITYENEKGLIVQAEGYKAIIYNEKGVAVGHIPETMKDAPATKSDIETLLSGKGYIETMDGRTFNDVLDNKELSIKNISNTVDKVTNRLKNPYVEKVSYKNIDISYDKSALGFAFEHHYHTKNMGIVNVKSNPMRISESREYLEDRLSEELTNDILNKTTPEIDVHINIDALMNDVEHELFKSSKTVDESIYDRCIKLTDEMKFVPSEKQPEVLALQVKVGPDTFELTDPEKIKRQIERAIKTEERVLERLDEIPHRKPMQHRRKHTLTKRLEENVMNQTVTKTRETTIEKGEER